MANMCYARVKSTQNNGPAARRLHINVRTSNHMCSPPPSRATAHYDATDGDIAYPSSTAAVLCWYVASQGLRCLKCWKYG